MFMAQDSIPDEQELYRKIIEVGNAVGELLVILQKVSQK
jgi:hypothetical protein